MSVSVLSNREASQPLSTAARPTKKKKKKKKKKSIRKCEFHPLHRCGFHGASVIIHYLSLLYSAIICSPAGSLRICCM